MVNVNVTGGEMSQAEINSYIDRAQKLYPEKTIPDYRPKNRRRLC